MGREAGFTGAACRAALAHWLSGQAIQKVATVAHADYLLGTYRPGALCRQLLDELVPIQSARVGIVVGAGMISKIDRDLRDSLAGATLLDVSHRFEEAVLSGLPDTLRWTVRGAAQ